MLKNRIGFTVIETLIVLFISMISLVLLMMLSSFFQDKNQNEHLFWKNFNQEWQLIGRSAMQNQDSATIIFGENNVVFKSSNHDLDTTLTYPKGLKILTPGKQVFVNDNGYSSPKTIRWYSNSLKQYWNLKFQLGWGVYRLEKG